MFALNPQLEDHLRTHDDNFKSDDATFTRDGNAQQIQVVVEAEKQSLAKDNIMIHNHQCHECRLQVSAILGSIQAPPLSSPESLSSPSSPSWVGVRCCEEEMHETDLTKQIEIVVNFAKVHANLFTSFQLALETISLGTGLTFGLGPSSQSVIRVEMATLGRAHRIKEHQPSTEHSRCGFGGAMALHNARTLVCTAMIQDWRSLETIFTRRDDDPERNNNYFDYSRPPDVLTLSWFKSFQRDLAKRLSMTLSILSTTASLQKLTLQPSILGSRVQVSVWMAKESCQHVTSLFSLDSDYQPNSGARSTCSSSSFQKHRNRLCRQLDAAHVALWASEEVERAANKGFQNEKITNDNTACEKSNGSLKMWLAHIETLLATAVDVHREMTQDLVGRKPLKKEPTFSPGMYNDINQYEDGGETSGLSTQNLEEATKWKTKTAVFSATGDVQQTPARSIPDFAGPLLSARNNNNDTKNNANLLYELQSRLELMELHEEVEIVPMVPVPELPKGAGPQISRSSLFLGATDGLLAELKDNIQKSADDMPQFEINDS